MCSPLSLSLQRWQEPFCQALDMWMNHSGVGSIMQSWLSAKLLHTLQDRVRKGAESGVLVLGNGTETKESIWGDENSSSREGQNLEKEILRSCPISWPSFPISPALTRWCVLFPSHCTSHTLKTPSYSKDLHCLVNVFWMGVLFLDGGFIPLGSDFTVWCSLRQESEACLIWPLIHVASWYTAFQC